MQYIPQGLFMASNQKRTNKAPKIISFTGQKGGVGKSTIAVNVAAGLSILGYKVLIIDTDEHQASIRDAFALRDDSNISTVCIQTRSLLKELKKPQLTAGSEVVIVDGEGHMHEKSRAAIEVSDYFVVPIQPSQFDINSYARYIASVIEPVSMYRELEGGVVLSRTKNGASSRHTREALGDYILPIFDIDISESESFREAAGLGLCVSELRPKIKASRTFFKFLIELCDAVEISTKKVTFDEFSKRACLRSKAKNKGRNYASKEKNNSTKTESGELCRHQ